MKKDIGTAIKVRSLCHVKIFKNFFKKVLSSIKNMTIYTRVGISAHKNYRFLF